MFFCELFEICKGPEKKFSEITGIKIGIKKFVNNFLR